MGRRANPPKKTKALRIVCATDLLPGSEPAIERAGILAERLNADLSLLHVVVPSESERALEQDLKLAIERVRSRARPPLWQFASAPNVIVKTGSASNRIVETIDEVGAHLLVMGAHRRRSVQDALRGSTAEKLLSSQASPVLIVQRPAESGYRRVLVALDMSPDFAPALGAAETLVMSEESEPVAVHAHEPPYEGMLNLTHAGVREDAMAAYARSWTRETENAVNEFLRRHASGSIQYDIALEQARPAAGIQRAADRLHPDLVVLGTRGQGRLRRALLGSVAREVLNTATSDLLIIPDASLRASQWASVRPMKSRAVLAPLPPF